MTKYIGTKVILAKPMTRGDYNTYRGWTIPENENPADEGYLVKYSDDYESWSPKEQFERAYRSFDGGMSFGSAIELLKMGYMVARKGWNGKGMYLFLVKGQELYNPIKYNHEDIDINQFPPVDVIAMKTVNSIQVGWLASQTDMLAEDWFVILP